MPRKYNVLNVTGGAELPVANGTLSTQVADIKDMDIDQGTGVFIIAFYDANGDPVTPSAGTIIPEAAPIRGQWHAPSSGDATINATDVVAGSSLYAIPVFTGPVIAGRLTFTGILGAVTARALFWRE